MLRDSPVFFLFLDIIRAQRRASLDLGLMNRDGGPSFALIEKQRRETVLKEFKEFAMRGNVMDMAAGKIVGAAFGEIVRSEERRVGKEC